MALESGVTYIEDLVSTNPSGTDDISEGDDHIRNIKTAVQGSFSNLGATAVTKTASEINGLAQAINGTLTTPVINNPVINGGNGYGMAVLDGYDLLVSTVSSTGFTSFDMSAAGGDATIAAAAGAKIGIFSVDVFANSSSSSSNIFVSMRATGSSSVATDTAVAMTRPTLEVGGSGTTESSSNIIQCHVPLDGNSDFDYAITTAGISNLVVKIYLVGYYV